jgi:hypothetical protein
MKIQKIILCCAVAPAAFGASLGLLELGNYVRSAFLSPKSDVEISNVPQTPTLPSIVPPNAEFKMSTVVVPASETVEEEPENEWGETGDYYIAGKYPKGFADFDSLSIVTREWNYEKQRIVAAKPSGSLQTYEKDKTGTEYKFSAININGKRISIVTRSVKGVSYQFDGKFVLEEYKAKLQNGEEYIDAILLKGRLTKWRGGKKIAEAKVNLEIGGC